MSLLGISSRVLIRRQVNAGAISLGKFVRTQKIEDRFEYVQDYDDRDRSEIIDADTSIRYLESEAYKLTYGDDVVWKFYRRNHPGNESRDTRETCIRSYKVNISSPCPICRDKYLVPNYRNVKLLKQFISPHYGGLLPTKVTGVCQLQQHKLKLALMKAKEYGLISFDLPVRYYDYSYYERLSKKHIN